MADLVEVAGVWRKQDRNGGTYYSGRTKEDIVIPAGSYINVFKNRAAEEDERKPALRVLFSAPDGQAAPPRKPAQDYSQRGRTVADDDLEDDIPF